MIPSKECEHKDCKVIFKKTDGTSMKQWKERKWCSRSCANKAREDHLIKITPITDEEKVRIFELREKGCDPKSIAKIMGRCENTITMELRKGPIYGRPKFMWFMQFRANQITAKRERALRAEVRRKNMKAVGATTGLAVGGSSCGSGTASGGAG